MTGQKQVRPHPLRNDGDGLAGSARHWHRYERPTCCLPGWRRRLSCRFTPWSRLISRSGSFRAGIARSFPPTLSRVRSFPASRWSDPRIPLRVAYGLHDFITARHLENMAKVMLATGMVVAYGYLMESFMAWYSQNPYEAYTTLHNRPFGPYAHTYWMMLTCNVFVPQLLWLRSVRLSVPLLWIISIIVNIGMWLERYVIVVTSLSRDYLPSAWSIYNGTFWDYATFYGSLGLFFFLFFLFIRFLPVISIAEMRELVHEAQERTVRSGLDAREEGA